MSIKQKEKFVSVTKAAEILGISRQALRKRIIKEPRPQYVCREGRNFSIDIQHIAFKVLIQESKNKIQIKNQKKVSKKKATKKKTKYEKEIEKLQFQSLAAKLQLPIQKTELNAYKIEQEKLTLAKDSRRLIEYELAEYLFLGYLERINRETLNFPKRVTREIELIIQGGIHTGLDSHKICAKIIKIISRELEAILRDIIKEQKKDVVEWKAE